MRPRRFKSVQSKSFIQKRQIKAVFSSIIVIVVFASVIFIFSYLSSLSVFTITNVQISGTDNEQSKLIHATVLETLDGNYFGIFSRSNMFMYPKSKINSKILKSFPDISNVSIKRDGLKTLNISIREKTPSALICNTLPDFNGNDLSLDDPGSCYFADSTGFIYKKSPSFSGNYYNRYYIPNLASTSIVGLYATSTKEFSSLQNFYNRVKNNNISVEAILINDQNEYELYAKNPSALKLSSSTNSTESTVVIYFNRNTSLEDQLSNLVSFWMNMITTVKTKNKPMEFDYIDVRYGANVFYREVK